MKSRRHFIASAASTLAASAANSEIFCSNFDFNGIQVCEVGIPTDSVFEAEQGCENWCWAACLQTILDIHGFEVNQTEIVRRVYSDEGCYTATGFQIATQLSGYWKTDNDSFHVRVAPVIDLSASIWTPSASAIVAQELARGFPLINGALGHATVITGMRYARNQFGQGQPLEIIVRDPWPSPGSNRRRLTPNEAFGTFFIASVRVS